MVILSSVFHGFSQKKMEPKTKLEKDKLSAIPGGHRAGKGAVRVWHGRDGEAGGERAYGGVCSVIVCVSLSVFWLLLALLPVCSPGLLLRTCCITSSVSYAHLCIISTLIHAVDCMSCRRRPAGERQKASKQG